jgi:predicted metal-dependent hydrolase
MEYELIFSDRKTISASVKGGKLTVRAPRSASREFIEKFLAKHKKWIAEHLLIEEERMKKSTSLTPEEIVRMKKEAELYLKAKTKYYSEIMNLKHGRITITSAESRFGSCSSKGNICFSYRLMLYPEAAREYVVVHELAHLIEMNHSKKFYAIVEKYLPDYKERRRMLK